MITKRHSLKSISLDTANIEQFVAYLESQIDKKSGVFSRVEVSIGFSDDRRVDLSTKDDATLSKLLRTTLDEDVELVESIEVTLRSEKLDVSFKSNDYFRETTLNLSSKDNDRLVIALEQCKKKLKWVSSTNHLASMWWVYFVSVFLFNVLGLALLYKLFPSSSLLPEWIQYLLLGLNIIVTIAGAWAFSEWLEKRYSKLRVFTGSRSSSASLSADWKKFVLPTIIIPIILSLLFLLL